MNSIKHYLFMILRFDYDEFPVVVPWEAAPWYWKAIDFVVKYLTFGKISFHDDYYVISDNKIIKPDKIKEVPLGKIIHESVHFYQRKREGKLKYYLKYLFYPFPVFFTKRSEWEWEAYLAESLFYCYIGQDFKKVKKTYLKSIVKTQFFNLGYFFMDINRWGHYSSLETIHDLPPSNPPYWTRINYFVKKVAESLD